MEQSILENSKGATYMSFILDIEIVIKKDGARANLAETKAKSQVSKKEGESKEPFAASRNQDVKVYAVSAPPRKSIFELPLGNDQESDASKSNKDTKNAKMSRSFTSNKENIPENLNFQEKTDGLGIVEKPSISDGETLAANNVPVRPKKKKISKAEKKAKVFKGKVEPIDFLECNRIFMCNYLKLPFYRHKRNFNIDNRLSDSKVIVSEENSSKVIGVQERSLSTQKLDKQTFKTLRQHKFAKRNSFNLVNKDSKPDIYSSGDCGTIINASSIDSNEFEIGNLSKIDNGESKSPEIKNRTRRNPLISEFKFSRCKANTSLTRNIDTLNTKDSESVSTEYSYVHNKQGRNTVLRKCKSTNIPKIVENMNSKVVNSTKSDINQHYKTNNKKGFSFIRALNRKRNEKTCTEKEGLSGLQINCFEDVNFLFAPQLNIESGSTQIGNCSKENIYMLKEEIPPEVAKHTYENLNELGEISEVFDNINGRIHEKGYSEIFSNPTKCSSVLEDRVASSNISMSVLKKCEIDEEYDIMAGNTELCQCTKNYVLPISLDNKPDSCVIPPQINISSSVTEENYLHGNNYKLGANSFDDNLESKELKGDSLNEKSFKTVTVLPSTHALNERIVETCDVDISQIEIKTQTPDLNEKRENRGGKPKTTKFKALQSYMKTVTHKLWK